MAKRSLAPRISADPGICHGRVVVDGTRIPVATILGFLSAGDSVESVLEEYALTREDVLACLAYAAKVIDRKRPCKKTTEGV